MKILRTSLALALLLLPLSACNKPETADSKAALIKIGLLNSDAFTTELTLDGGTALATGASHMGLLSMDATGQLQPGLAQSWRVSNDGRSYIFRLGKAKWADGRAITAGDVVAVLRRAVAPGSRHPLKPYLMAIENAPAVARNRKPQRMLGVQDVRPDIVEIRLHAPMPELLRLLALPAMAILRKGDAPPASGPFRLEKLHPDTLLLLPNADYSGPPAAAGLSVRRYAQAAAALQDMQDGKNDVLLGGGVEGLSAARTAGPGAQLVIEPSYGLYGFVLRSIDGPLSDVRVRRALSLAVDRQTLVARLFSVPAMQPTSLPVPPALLEDSQTEISDPEAQQAYSNRRAHAERLLAEAGYSPTHPLILDVAVPSAQVHRDILALLAEDWTALGVELHIRVRSVQDHAQSLKRGNFDMALVHWQSPLALVPVFLEQYRCQKALGGYCNPRADAWLDAGWRSPDLTTRNMLWRKAIDQHMAEVPALMLFQPVRWMMFAPDITGVQANIYGQHPLQNLARTAPRGRLAVLKK